MKTKTRFHKFAACLLTVAMVVGMLPMSIVTVAETTDFSVTQAVGSAGNRELSRTDYEALGFDLGLETTDESYIGPGNSTMNVKNELYLNYNGSSHYGWVLRDNLNLNHANWNGYGTIGAYKLYGQYRNGDWAHLNEGNGYTNGQTGGEASVIGSSISSKNTHQSRTYETSVAYRSASGREDRVAQLYVKSSTKRADFTACLEIVKFVASDGKYAESVVRNVVLGKIPALDEAGNIYNPIFDALFEVTAGDFDGDGIDEIAVYYGTNEVKIYDTGSRGDSLSLWKTIGASEILKDQNISAKKSADSTDGGVMRAAIVALSAGDLKKDHTDDLVITVSMPVDDDSSCLNAHQQNPHAYVYGANSTDSYISSGEFTKDLEVPLRTDDLQGDTSKPQVFRAANATVADIDGNACMDLLIGGRLGAASETDGEDWSVGALIHVKYEHGSKNYSVGKPYQIELKEYDGDNVLRNGSSSAIRYFPPVALAVADLDGVGSDAPTCLFFAELFTFDPSTRSFTGTGKYLDTIKNQKNNADEGEDKTDHWVSDVVVGNFIDDSNGSEQFLAIIACKQDDDDWYWYYMSYVAQYDDKICAQCEGIINQARSYINKTDKSRASVYVSVACPDVDNDGVLLEYVGTSSYYTKPEVQAVLQSAPYFADVADVYDNYLNNGATAYGKVEGSMEGSKVSVGASLGMFTSAETSLGAASEIEFDISVTTDYEHMTSTEVETSVERSGDAGDDYVILYTIPYHRYYYNATWPDGTKGPFTIEEPMIPATVIVPVETYDAIAEGAEGLEPIRGNILTSTPGDPSSYTLAPKGKWTSIGDVQLLTNAGSNSGSLTTISQTASNSEENSFAVGVEQNLEIGFGGGGLGNDVVVGVQQGSHFSAGGVYSDMSGATYTGAVDNLPAGVEGYAFNWQFGISNTKLNGEDIIVVGYITSNVKQAPSLPKELTVTDITDNSVVLEWKADNDAAMFEVDISRDQATWLPLDPIPSTMADSDGKISYTVSELNAGTTYYFRVVSANAYGVRSLETAPVVGTTLGSDGKFSIAEQPKDTSAAKGLNATFATEIVSDSNKTIFYEWQYNGGGNWTKISGSNTSVLTVKDVTPEMDGRKFRCRISQGADYIYTRTATLTVSKTPTSATLTIANGAESVANGDTVQANFSVSEDIVEAITKWHPVTKTDGGKTYSMMATSEEATTDADGIVTNYTYTAPYFWVDESGKLYAVGADNTIGAEYTDAYRVFHDKKDDGTQGDLTVEASAFLTTGLPEVEITTDVKSTSGYKVGDTYVYVAEVAVDTGEEGSTAIKYYYKSDASYVEMFHDESADYIIADGEKCRPNSLVPMQTPTLSQVVTGQNVTTVDGDKLTLKASVSPVGITGNVAFQITNLTTGSTQSVNAKKSGDQWTAEYALPSAGVYEVRSSYGGSDVYFGSNSEPIKIYAVNAGKSLSISGGNITYGSSLNLAPIIVSKDSKSPITSDNSVTYTVKKDGEEVSGLVNKNIFIPAEVGNYTVTATYNDGAQDYTTSVVIKVHPKIVQIAAQPAKASLHDGKEAREAQLVATVTGMASADAHLLEYSVTSDATTAVANGDYRIDVKVDSDVRAVLEKKYSLVLTPGVFTLEQGSVRVYAEAVSNGSVNITYTTTVSDSNGTYTSTPLRVESGALLPIGADVTITAAPHAGFGVEKWVVDREEKAGGNLSYTIDNLQKSCSIEVYFTQTFNSLNFGGTQDCGSVTGTYVGGNSVFNSGDSINLNQSVVLTATPAEGYVVAAWTRNGEPVMADDGTSFFTGEKVTVSHVAETVTYFVTFEQKSEVDITVKFVDKSGAPVSGCSVNINQQNITGTDNVFTLNTHNHANLDIKVAVPDNMLIDHWELNGQVVANAVDELTVYDLVSSAEYTVICVTPNQRGLTFGTELIDTNGGTVAEAGTITATRSGNAISSGTNVPQGAVVTFTAEPAEGYRIAKWTMGAYQVAGKDVESYQLTMDQNAEVKVHFEKKPTITLDIGSGGSANLQVGSVTSTEKETVVNFESNVQVNIVPAAGYVADSVTITAAGQTQNAVLAADKDIRYATLENVTQNTTVNITYKAKPVVRVDSDANGAVTLSATKDFATSEISSGSYVDFGSNLDVEISPVKGFVVDVVTINGENVTLTDIANSDNKRFTISNVQENSDIAVTYRALHTISVIFGVIDKNDDEAGGLNGTLSVHVERKGMEAYAATDDTGAVSTIYEGSIVTFAPVPEAGYKVSKWFVNGEETVQAPVITVTDGIADQNVMAQFDYVGENISFSITGASDKASLSAVFIPSGGVSQDFASGNKPAANGVVTITVNALDNNYKIEGWYVNGEKQQTVSDTLDYAATVGVGADITVNIIRKSYTVAFSATEGTIGAVSSGNTVASGDLLIGDSIVTFTAEPKAPTGYSFLGWTVNGLLSTETAQTLSLVVTEDLIVEATYRLNAVTHQVTYGVVGSNGETGGLNGTLTLSGHNASPASVDAGDAVLFTAIPDTHYRVAGWYSDPAGTMPISDTTVEQNTYSVKHITAPLSVYVKFEPVPQYIVNIETIGLGTVTAKVNGEEVSIENGNIIVWRYDDVMLTATPSEHQYLSGWTVNETASGNQFTLTLTDVKENTDVTAEFSASQNVELRTEAVKGSIEIKAGFGEQLEYINPETGIVIHKGQNVELTVTPDSGMMVDKWIVNGVEKTDYLDHTLRIEAIDKDTTVRVECIELVLHNLPADDAENRYVVTDILETPEKYGTDKQVRDRGTVSFVVESTGNNIITELQVAAGADSRVNAKKISVNKWNVTIENVTADIVLTPTIVLGRQLEVNCSAGGKIVITKNGEVIANDSTLLFGDEIVIKAEANRNYKLTSLTLNGNKINSSDTYTVVSDDERILINATFAARSQGSSGSSSGSGGGGGVPTYTVKFETNGGNEIKAASVSFGGKVTKPAAPTKNGYTFDGWYTDKDLTVAYDFATTVSKSLTLYAKWKESGNGLSSVWQNPFEDVKSEHWFYDDVRFVNENGFMNGVSEKHFAPNENVTRAMLVTVLYRAEGEPEVTGETTFEDIDENAYYAKAVVWGQQNGIIKGYSEAAYAPDQDILREQIAAIMHRYAEYKGYDVSVGENTNILSYDDFDSISEYALVAMQYACDSGLIKGKTDKTLNPLDNATRAEVAAILHRFVEANNK